MKKIRSHFTKKCSQKTFAVFIFVLILLAGVRINAQTTDTTPPEIVEFEISPLTIDTTDNSQNVGILIRATDAQRGVRRISVRFSSLQSSQSVLVVIDDSNRITGDRLDGVYKAAGTFPKFSKAGEWRVAEVHATDNLNAKTLYTPDLINRGFNTRLQVVSDNEDLTPPAIVEFDFDPSSINTYGNSRSVTATVRAIDMKAGVRSITVIFHRPGDDFLYGISMDASNRVSGDDKDGVYTQTRIFPQNTPPGIYEAFVSVTDTLGNSYFINAGELARRRFPHELKINFAAPGELVSIYGRVLKSDGKPVSRAVVTLTEADGTVRYAITNAAGFYRFSGVKAGDTFTFSAAHKSYIFEPFVYTVVGERGELNFYAN